LRRLEPVGAVNTINSNEGAALGIPKQLQGVLANELYETIFIIN
jgi:hypothetical protein